MRLAQRPRFQNYHRVLNRAVWSPLAVSRILLGLLSAAFVPDGPLVMALDDTLERRRGAHIAATGIYRDPARSSESPFVKARGLRWLCLMLLVPIPWATRVWALPFLMVLAPSERYRTSRARRHKTVLDWARQLILLLHRWCPRRPLVVVADSRYAALELLARCSHASVGASLITRLRLDAALYEPEPPPALAGGARAAPGSGPWADRHIWWPVPTGRPQQRSGAAAGARTRAASPGARAARSLLPLL
jgi:hypothetical protein